MSKRISLFSIALVGSLAAVMIVGIPQLTKTQTIQSHASGFVTPSPLIANNVTVKFTAQVAAVQDPSNLLGGAIKPNQTLTGSYTYNINAQNISNNPNLGSYKHTSAPYGISVQGGGLTFQSDPNHVNFLIEIDRNVPLGSSKRASYALISSNNLPVKTSVFINKFFWNLYDSTNTAVSSSVLTAKPPILSKWNANGLVIGGGNQNTSNPSKSFMIQAHIISVQ